MLTKRLAACAALVTEGGVVCDVGTDHAYLPAELLRQNRCPRAVVTDIHAGPLEAARRTLTETGVLARAELLLCDGLEQVLPEGITDVVVAGMGGETIVHILENCPWRAQAHLILQPMTKLPVLRQWLAKNGFDWTEQVVSEGGKFYVVLDVQSAAAPQPLTLLEQELGRIDWQEPCASAYASWKLKRFQKLAQQLKQAGVPEYSLWESLAEETAANLGRNPR